MKFVHTNRDFIDKLKVAYRASATISDTATSAGEIDVRFAKTLTLFLTYTKGTETGLTVTIKALHTTSGTEYQTGGYANASGSLTQETHTYLWTASANAVPIELDVTGYSYIKVYEVKTGGTASGTLVIDYIRSNVI